MERPRKSTDIYIEAVECDYEHYGYRTPIKFGGNVVDRATILNVTCTVRTRAGRVARGWGSMPLGNVWSFPSKVLAPDTTLEAMRALAQRIARLTASYEGAAHPIAINAALEPEYLKAAGEVSRQMGLAEPIPKLCALTAASPFDAAIHDAYGRAHGLNCYETYSREFVNYDLSHDLGPEFGGRYLSDYISPRPKARMPLYHLVGALDPIEAEDVVARVGDGLPETLPEWIERDGLTHLKIKLNGDDLDWDVDRVVRVDRATAAVQERRGVDAWVYSLDFNEKAADAGYVLDFLDRLEDRAPAGRARIQYIEQPTARDLRDGPSNDLHEVSRQLPVVADEALTDIESLLRARERGYTGAALKACKGQSQALLLAAAAQESQMFLCVQDLTCPGASLIHSAGLAAHLPGVRAIEANARQYMPEANARWARRFPGLFVVSDGMLETAGLDGPGLGAVDG